MNKSRQFDEFYRMFIILTGGFVCASLGKVLGYNEFTKISFSIGFSFLFVHWLNITFFPWLGICQDMEEKP